MKVRGLTDRVKIALLKKSHLRDMRCHLPYGITQCYLPPDTSELAQPNVSH